MKIVIDIPDEKYEVIKSVSYYTFPKEMKEWGLEAIRNGTPLPKGHGRLIDADKMKNKMLYSHDIGAEIETNGTEATINYIFDDAPTIIEADTESEVEE